MILVGLGLQTTAAFSPLEFRPWLVIASYLLLLGAIAYNLDRQCLRIIFVGLLLNITVIALNGGKMPVSLPLAESLGYDTTALVSGHDFKRIVMTNTTGFNFLGDIIYIPVPIARVVSLGDILIALGAFLMVQDFMAKPLMFRTTKLLL